MVLLPSVAFQLIDPDLKAYSPRLTKHRIIISSLDYIKILIILCGICAALLIIKITNIRMPEQCVHYSLFIIYPSESQQHFKKASSSCGFVCVGACTHIFVQPNVCVCVLLSSQSAFLLHIFKQHELTKVLQKQDKRQ